MEFVKSKQGKDVLHFTGFKFTYSRKVDGKSVLAMCFHGMQVTLPYNWNQTDAKSECFVQFTFLLHSFYFLFRVKKAVSACVCVCVCAVSYTHLTLPTSDGV